jgi:hypothetical protein
VRCRHEDPLVQIVQCSWKMIVVSLGANRYAAPDTPLGTSDRHSATAQVAWSKNGSRDVDPVKSAAKYPVGPPVSHV